jgi:hypothetical protein
MNNLNRLLDAITLLRRQLSTRLQKEDDTGDTRQHVSLVTVSRFHDRRTLSQGPLKRLIPLVREVAKLRGGPLG